MKNHLFAFAMFTISFGFSQTTFSLNDIEYTVTDETEHTVETTAYTGSATDVNIPAVVTHESIAYSVTSIGKVSFYGKSLTSVTIPNSVIRIGLYAFFDNALVTVDFPDSVTSIDDDAFAYNSLTSVSFSNNLHTIDGLAFRNNSITSLIIPASVTSIGVSAFLSNPISSITSLSLNPFSLAIDVFGIDRDYTGINLVIPTGTATAYATAGWTGFKTVTEDDSLLSTPLSNLTTRIKFSVVDGYLQLEVPEAVKISEVNIYSVLGACVATTNEKSIRVSTWPKGIYIVRVDTNKGMISKKIVW